MGSFSKLKNSVAIVCCTPPINRGGVQRNNVTVQRCSCCRVQQKVNPKLKCLLLVPQKCNKGVSEVGEICCSCCRGATRYKSKLQRAKFVALFLQGATPRS